VYLRVSPFTYVMWARGWVERRFSPVVQRFERFASLAELDLVKLGFRECDVFHVYPESMYDGLSLVYERGLRFQVIDVVRRYSGFAHYHERPRDVSEVLYYGAVCRSEAGLREMVEAHRRGDHDKIGELLGYPKCDRRFFVENWGRGRYDMVPEVAVNTPGSRVERVGDGDGLRVYSEFDPLLNIAVRYAGLRFLPYFPHSFDCPESVRFAGLFMSAVYRYDREAVYTVAKLLSLPIVWSQANGIIEVSNGVLRIVAGGFEDTFTWVKLKPRYILSRSRVDSIVSSVGL